MRGVAVSRGALLALIALLALPGTAGAVTHVSINSNFLRAFSDPGEKNELMIEFDISNGDLLVLDGAQGVSVAAPCVIVAGHAECPLAPADTGRILARTGDRSDTVEEGLLLSLVEPFLDALDFRPTLFKLGPGNDLAQLGQGRGRIVGGPGNDRMVGLEGPDTLIGGPGNDVLDRRASSASIRLNGGRDRYLAGPGVDRIRARDFTRDVRISCGPGRDIVSRDRFDPRPSGCP
jgi:Ca2+-binding RTX toxin-like protein